MDVLDSDGPTLTASATECAMQQRYRPARDEAGNPAAGMTHVFLVRFEQ